MSVPWAQNPPQVEGEQLVRERLSEREWQIIRDQTDKTQNGHKIYALL